MKFDITRTSKHFGVKNTTEPPCIDAYRQDGCWCINIDSLEELVDIANREGPLIISSYRSLITLEREQTIEIYDDYRE